VTRSGGALRNGPATQLARHFHIEGANCAYRSFKWLHFAKLGILRSANVGKQTGEAADAETTPLRNPEEYQYDLRLADIAELWRRGSVIASWLLDLTAAALLEDPQMSRFSGRVSDSGEGRWTIKAAIDEAVPVPVLSSALYQRFSSRGEADFADKLLSAMRYELGGHLEKSPGKDRAA
jgi:6-phosphogluconate dehydrogenase